MEQLALLAPGPSEDPTSQYYTNNLTSWVWGTMHPAPIPGSFPPFDPIVSTYEARQDADDAGRRPTGGGPGADFRADL